MTDKMVEHLKELQEDREHWRTLALHALSDLRAMGVPIEKILGITVGDLKAVTEYDREMTSYT